jgi:hypothetical protein
MVKLKVLKSNPFQDFKYVEFDYNLKNIIGFLLMVQIGSQK